MKKIKSKVFFTILAILTSFLIFICFMFNYQDYNKEKLLIKSNLVRLNKDVKRVMNGNDDVNDINNIGDDIVKDALNKRIFMDYTVYTVLLNSLNEITDIVSHDNYNTNVSNIGDLALEIIDNNEKRKIGINNLYFSNYSYYYRPRRFIIIIDNTIVRERLLSNLQESIVLFIILELLILYLAGIITNFLMRPVIDSFDKQKRFIADASHELKTPISVIMASADAIKIDNKERKWVNNIKNEAERMNKLVIELLDLAKLEQSQNKELYVNTDISKLIEMSILTLESQSYKIAQFIGQYVISLGGVDAIVFTGGVGENGFETRERICNYLEVIGAKLDKKVNKQKGKEIKVSTEDSKVAIYVVPTNEELMIARDTKQMIEKMN